MANKNKLSATELQDINDSYSQEVRKGRLNADVEDIEYSYIQHLKKERLKELSGPISTKEKYRRPRTVEDKIIGISKRIHSADEKEIDTGSVKLEILEHQTLDNENDDPLSWKSPPSSSSKKDRYLTLKEALKSLRYTPSSRITELAKPVERKTGVNVKTNVKKKQLKKIEKNKET